MTDKNYTRESCNNKKKTKNKQTNKKNKKKPRKPQTIHNRDRQLR